MTATDWMVTLVGAVLVWFAQRRAFDATIRAGRRLPRIPRLVLAVMVSLAVGALVIASMVALSGCGDDLTPSCGEGQVTFLRDCDGEWGGEAECVDASAAPVVGCVATKQYTETRWFDFTCVAACERRP